MKKTMAAAEAKTHLLSLLDQVEQSRQEIIITKRGRAVARLVPLVGDIVSPVDTGWNE
jgi:prevent-host-death family protein